LNTERGECGNDDKDEQGDIDQMLDYTRSSMFRPPLGDVFLAPKKDGLKRKLKTFDLCPIE